MNSPILSPLPVDPLDSSMGALLVDAGKLTIEGAERALRMQKDLGIRFGEAAVRLGRRDGGRGVGERPGDVGVCHG